MGSFVALVARVEQASLVTRWNALHKKPWWLWNQRYALGVIVGQCVCFQSWLCLTVLLLCEHLFFMHRNVYSQCVFGVWMFLNVCWLCFSGGSTGTSPTTSSTGTPSPSGATHLLSPSCSPPTFHLAPNTFNVGCRESQLCNLGLSEYPACARSNMAALQGYGGLADGSYGRLQATGGAVTSAQASDSFLPQRTSSLIAGGMQGGAHASLASGNGIGGCKVDAYGSQLASFPASQLQYVMQAGASSASGPSASSGSSPSSTHMFSGSHHHVQQSTYNAFSLHNPYNLYGYNFPASPRLAPSPEKPQGGLLCSSSTAGAFAERQYLSNSGMESMHMIGNPAGSQQGAGSCDGRQYGSSSQMSMHMVWSHWK